jgi:hypothetical protein
VEGDTVVFHIGGLEADETGTWHSGTNVQLNLTAGTPTQQTIIVEKQTDPDGAPDSFTFSGDATGTISDGQQIVVSGLQPGTYTSQETVPAGWDLTSIVCDDDNSSGDLNTQTATFVLEAGETVKCTFTNVQVPPDYFIYLPLIQNNSAVATAWSWGVSLPRSPVALPYPSVCPVYLLFTLMTLGLASSALGKVSISRPFSKTASALSASTDTLSVSVRENAP